MPVLGRRLTKSVVDALQVEAGRRQSLYWDSDLTGFGVLVSETGAKTYVLQRKNLRVTIDRTNVISVDAARQRAMETLALIGQGINPREESMKRKAADDAKRRGDLTVRQVWEAYCKAKKLLRPKTLSEYEYELTTYCADWIDSPLRNLTRAFVESEHTRIRTDVSKRARSKLANGNSTANSVMRLVRALWNFADSNEIVPDLGRNPVQALSKNRAWYPEPPRERFIPEAHLPVFYRAIDHYESAFLVDSFAYRDLIKLMLFTGLRRGEAMHLRWDNVDLDAKVIRLTADQTKANRRLDLPMSDFVATLLDQRPRLSEWVFAGEDGPISDPPSILQHAASELSAHFAKESPDERSARGTSKHTGWRDYYYSPHVLRRTFVTVAESCDVSMYTLKAMVNHSFGDDVTAIYIGKNLERLREGAQKVTDKMKRLCRGGLTLLAQESAA